MELCRILPRMASSWRAYKSKGMTKKIGQLVSFRPLCSTTPTPPLYVCGCWSIPSIFFLFLLFSSFSSLLSFCVASQPVTTTTTALGPTSNTDNSDPPTPTLPFKATGSHFDPKITIALISVSSALFLSIMAFLFKCLILKKSKRRTNCNQIAVVVDHDPKISMDVDDDSVRKYSWADIERLTLNFSKVIGSGGFSDVYLARFPAGSTQGAIKIHIGSDRLNQVFKQELDILLRLRHDNIIKLLGYCDEREEGALVFEYVPNGNLQEKLHGRSTAERKAIVPWRNRMAIAFQLAQAIEYLHEKCSLQIVHGDIKASNMLLDENLNCKLCDFGSAKMGFSSTVLPLSSSSRAKQVIMMIGSPGYTDPHYLRTGIASKKNDIYSMGVIILELVTGMEAFCPERGELLTTIAAPLLRDVVECEATEKVAEIVDPRLAGEFDLEEARAMLFISAICLGHSPTLRPSATQILQTIKDKVSSISFLFSPQKDCQHTIN